MGLGAACTESPPPASTSCAGNVDCPAGQRCEFDSALEANVCVDDDGTTSPGLTSAASGVEPSTGADPSSTEGTSASMSDSSGPTADSTGTPGSCPAPFFEVDGECLGITRLDFLTTCTASNVEYTFDLPPGADTLIVPSVTVYGPGDVLIEPDGSRDQVFHIETSIDRGAGSIDVTIGCALAGDVPNNALQGYVTAIGLPSGSLVGTSAHPFTHAATCGMSSSFTQPLPAFDDAAFDSVTRFTAVTALELPTWFDTSLHNRDTTFETSLMAGEPWELTGRLNGGTGADSFRVQAYQVGLPATGAVRVDVQSFDTFTLSPPEILEFEGLGGRRVAPLVLVEDFDSEAPGQECNADVDNDLAFMIDVAPLPPTDGPMTEDSLTVEVTALSDQPTSEVRGQVVVFSMAAD
ncbi:MAG: hypothetical protein AAF799_44450 [Myxococcota bacterium]